MMMVMMMMTTMVMVVMVMIIDNDDGYDGYDDDDDDDDDEASSIGKGVKPLFSSLIQYATEDDRYNSDDNLVSPIPHTSSLSHILTSTSINTNTASLLPPVPSSNPKKSTITKSKKSQQSQPPLSLSTYEGVGGGGGIGAGNCRIQMFGSVYARHLSSSSPFAPPPVPKHQRISLSSNKATSDRSKLPFTKRRVIVEGSGGSFGGGSEVGSVQQGWDGLRNGSNVSGEGGIRGSFSATGSNAGDGGGGGGGGADSSLTFSSRAAGGGPPSVGCDIEDASNDVLVGAITDILITYGSEPPPSGYYRISRTSDGTQVSSLRKRKVGAVHLNIKKEGKWDRAVQRPCVTALVIIFPDRGEFVPPGFSVVRRQQNKEEVKSGKGGQSSIDGSRQIKAIPTSLNHGTSGERVYLCYRRSREGNPVTGLIPLQPSLRETIPEGYTVIEKTPRDHVADINSNAGSALFLAFRQRLANLEPLRPLPMVLSVKVGGQGQKYDSSLKKKKILQAYYCTGGTIVPARMSQFHLMDRSTHPLLSPSSVTNRISLIQASRVKKSSSSTGSTASTQPCSSGANQNRAYSSTGSTQSTLTSTIGGKDHQYAQTTPMSLAQGLAGVSGEGGEFTLPPIDGSRSGALIGISSPHNGTVMGVDTSEIDSVHSFSSRELRKPAVDDQVNPRRKSVSVLPSINSRQVISLHHPVPARNASMGDNNAHSNVVSSARDGVFVSHRNAEIQECFDAMSFIPLIETPRRLTLQRREEQKNADIFLQARIAVITPILTACYSQHGGSALLAVEGLSRILNETNFFQSDVSDDPQNDSQISTRLTLLDLSVQVVSDVATCSARETSFLSCVEFVSDAVVFSGGNLNSRTFGYAIRFYLFVFEFGATSSWPRNTQVVKGYDSIDISVEIDDVPLLSNNDIQPSKGSRLGYAPGGASQAAALALKELITVFLERLPFGASKGDTDRNRCFTPRDDGTSEFMSVIVDSLIDGAVDRVDVANYTQLALHQIQRSGGSELFWHDMMTSIGEGLFTSETSKPGSKCFYIQSFTILAKLVKLTSSKMRKGPQSFVPRDFSSKLLSLELLDHFLQEWHNRLDKVVSNKRDAHKPNSRRKINDEEDNSSSLTMAYCIRRLVVPTLLSNTAVGLEDIKIFRRIMKIVTKLWCSKHFRQQIKIEIGTR